MSRLSYEVVCVHGAACFALSTELSRSSPVLHRSEVGRLHALSLSLAEGRRSQGQSHVTGDYTDRSLFAHLDSERLRLFHGAVRTSFAVLRSCAPGPAVSLAQAWDKRWLEHDTPGLAVS